MSLRERLTPKSWLDALEVAAALAASLVFALGYGFHYGADNQVVYLLDALMVLRPDILGADWFASETVHYHRAFTYLAAPLMAASPAGWGIAAALTALVVAGMTGLYALARAVLPRRLALAGFLLTLAFASVGKTEGLAASYIFNYTFQPSTIGGAGLLVALALFARGRWLACGVVLAVAGLFHENYLILDFAAFGVAGVLLGRDQLVRRLALTLGPSFLVLLTLVPLILQSMRAGSPEIARQAQEILFEIRGPHHYDPERFKDGFTPLLVWQVLGLSVGWTLLRGREGRRLGVALVGILAVLWGGSVLSAAAHVPQVTRLFVWRLAPFSDLLSQFLVAGGAALLLAEPRRIAMLPPARVALIGGSLSLLLILNVGHKVGDTWAKLVIALAAAVVVAWLGARVVDRLPREELRQSVRRLWTRALPPLALVGGLAALVGPVGGTFERLGKTPAALDPMSGDERGLTAWMRDQSPQDARFLVPPDLAEARFFGQRAVVVDWKSSPILADELIEWKKRMADVTGVARFAGQRDVGNYHKLPREPLLAVARKYQADFIVVRRSREVEFKDLQVAFKNRGFVVLAAPK